MKAELYNKEALQRMQSPDDLDQLLVVVTPRSWLLVLSAGVLSLAALAWSIFGRIPITVDGFGVLVSPGNVRAVQAEFSALVTRVNKNVGDPVEQGEKIAELSQPALIQQLEQAREKLQSLERFDALSRRLDQDRRVREAEARDRQTESITAEMKEAERIADRTKEELDNSVKKQRKNLERTRVLLSELNVFLEERVHKIIELKEEGLTSDDMVLSARSSSMESELKVANIEVQAQDLELQDIRREQTDLQARSRLADLRLQLLQLPIKEMQLEQQLNQLQQTRDLEISDLKDKIANLKRRVQEESMIVANCSGRLLEISISAGQLLTENMRVAMIAVSPTDTGLKNLAYFKIHDGKRIHRGDLILVSPSDVERDLYGSILGRVARVTEFPKTKQGAVNLIGSEELVSALLSDGGAIEIEADLDSDPASPSGFRWTSKGPDKQFSAGTTTAVRVIVEQRRPITYVMPMLRNWLFGEKDADKLPAPAPVRKPSSG